MNKNTKTKQKSYMLAMVLMLMAVFGMTGVYVSEQRAEKQEQIALEEQKKQEQLALEEEQKQEQLALEEQKQEEIFMADNDSVIENQNFLDDPEVISGNNIQVEPEKGVQGTRTEEMMEQTEQTETSETTENTEISEGTEPGAGKTEQEEAVQETALNKVQKELHFDAANEMGWPLQGNVIMNYSMEQTVYFATLDQYKYNPALIIQGNVNDKVLSVADGKITQIETSEETGCTVTVDLGDGYSAVYGQLKEVPFAVEDYVKAGDIMGYVSEPTKYYSVEGPNLYFQITKDGESIDPMGCLQ